MNAINKDDIIELTINDLGSDGEGIGRVDGYTLFVKDALVGEVIKAKVIKTKKSYGYARLLEIITPSPYRVEPRCSKAKQCGGCQLQHLDYSKQLEYKQNKVKTCLTRIGKFTDIESKMEPIIGMEDPYYYRNKAQFPIERNKEGQVVTGFYASRSHSIIDLTHCYIQAEVNELILEKVKEFLTNYKISTYDEIIHKGLVRNVLTRVGYTTGEIMVCLVINGNKLPYHEELVESLREIKGMTSIGFNVNKDNTNVILGSKIVSLWGKPYITDNIGEIKYQISPLSFYQVNSLQTEKLYNTVLEYAKLTGTETVLDLYCGIGTISLFLARQAKSVLGVEIVEQAIKDARTNAEINQIDNVRFLAGAAEDIVAKVFEEEKIQADIVIVDPPRKGCDERLLSTIADISPKKIIYVSCDPATLARDLRYLCDRGYEIERVRAVDQFAQTVHVESIILMTYCGSKENNRV